MIRAGELIEQIQIQVRSSTLDALGEQSILWQTFATVRAAVTRTPGREVQAAAQTMGRVPTVFRVRYLAGVTPAMRVVWGARVYRILSAPPDGEGGLTINAEELVAETAGPDGGPYVPPPATFDAEDVKLSPVTGLTATDAQAALAEHQGDIDALNAENAARAAEVTAEAQARADGDDALASDLAAETTARADADTALQGSISDLQAASGIVRVPSAGVASHGYNLLANPEINSINSDVQSATVSGGGLDGSPLIIGSTDGTNAHYASIGGGYDNINDQLAGTIGGGAHHRLSLGTHGTIGGGSFGTVDSGADYATIAGGTGHTVSADEGTVGGGNTNKVTGQAATISGGSSNQASGLFAVVGGGNTNKAQGSNSVVTGGANNTASGDSSTIVGGNLNTASGLRSIIIGGLQNTASGTESIVFGGRDNVASASYSSARGYRASATSIGQHALANGQFAARGDAQTFEAVLRTTSTTQFGTTLGSGDSVGLLVLPDNTTWAFEVLVVARAVGSDEHAAYKLSGIIKRGVGAATTAIVGTVTKTVIAESVAAWDATAAADTTSGDLRIRGAGEASKSIRWVAYVRVASVTA